MSHELTQFKTKKRCTTAFCFGRDLNVPSFYLFRNPTCFVHEVALEIVPSFRFATGEN